MKTIKQAQIFPEYVELIPDRLKQGILYISKTYKTAIHLCLCGCGQQTVTPLHDIHGWKLIEEKEGAISLTPSIGNYQFACKSHYIITKNIANFV